MSLTTGAILGALAAIWVFTDARKRGRETGTALLWTVGVFFMLIIFLPLYLIFGRKIKPRPVPPAQLPDNVIDVDSSAVITTVNCPMCASQVNEDYKICPHCGYTLRPVCKNCGAQLDRTWVSCPHCQTPAAEK